MFSTTLCTIVVITRQVIREPSLGLIGKKINYLWQRVDDVLLWLHDDGDGDRDWTSLDVMVSGVNLHRHRLDHRCWSMMEHDVVAPPHDTDLLPVRVVDVDQVVRRVRVVFREGRRQVRPESVLVGDVVVGHQLTVGGHVPDYFQ